MANWLWRRGAPGEQGFSLVELLIVVIIMGVLSAIAIPLFFQQRANAADAAAEADVRHLGGELSRIWIEATAATAVTVAQVGNAYQITVVNGSEVETAGTPRSRNVELQPTSHMESVKSWCVGVTNLQGKVQNYAWTGAGEMEAGGVCDTSGGTATKP
ncbi:MAG: prepilin-type N-terminal cleavage/methylation domain-containing protein [Bifidobacteriaceae bacterium]|jgi:prepilin-type N-terminal cleavage/methylation domain-containing protein|nr:prepilin-type N-terminal cleavage/methylation domain-containing protein [Bifidobacteriaceae bacterium]